MKKILILLALLVVMTLVFVSCQDDPKPPVDDTTVADQPTEEPTAGEEDPTQAPDTDPETPAPDTDEPDEPTTPAPETQEPDTPAPDTQAPETPEPETADPMEPVNVFDAEDIQTVTGGDPSNMTQDCLTLEDGYVHVVPIGPDPYWYPFAGVDGARYVAIRYRTDATGADMQLYMSSTGNGPTDDTTMIRQPVIADGEWHVIIFDTQSLIDAGKYDGEYVSYFRFDPLEAGYKLDENGEPYKEESGQWARYSLPEGCMIDVAYIGFFHSEDAAKKYDFDLNKAPMWDADKSVVIHQNFDQFFLGNGTPDDATNNNLNLYHAVNIPNWDKVATLPDFSVETLTYWGWMSLAAETVGTFGYQIDMDAPIYDESFTFTPEQGVIDAALAGGGKAGTRFLIRINIAGLDGTHSVRVLYKDAEGAEVCLNEITVNLPELPDDITDSFTSDVNSNEVGTNMDVSDLSNFFVVETPLAALDPAAACPIVVEGENKIYNLTSISDFYADVNGRYFFKANVINSDGSGWMFARGYKVVNSDAIVEAFDPVGGFYKINNYYETDSAGAMGGAGIYARLQDGKLFIMVKYYNPETITRVGNKIYAIDAAGTELTLADNGSTVSVLVDGVTYATVELSGSIAYGDINEVDPAGEFAEKAVITLKDGTTETIENTLIAATCECQVGIVARAGSFKFDALAVGAYSAIEVPTLEIETPEEPEPVDPDAPVLVLDPEYINELAGSDQQTVAQHIGSHEIITEDGVTFVRLTSNGGDPYVALVKLGSYLELPPYMAFAYRTNCDLDAHVFIGSGSGWNGNGDVASVAWNQDNNWNLAVLDLNNVGLTSIQNGIISYCRFDFFTSNGEGNMDVEYVAFFNSAEAAQKYFDKLHGTDVPTEPEVTEPQEPETTEPQEPEVPSEPEFYENLVVPQDQWVITGHNTQLNDTTNPMVAAGGVESAALLHQGSIALGNIDLSKYSKVIVMWGCDNSEVTINHYNANANNRIMLLNAVMNGVMSPAAETIIAGGTYELKGWAVTAFEIDLTGIDYNGPVWLAIDALPGTFALFSSVEFIGAEKVDEPEHQHEYTTVVTDPTCTEGGYTTYTCACGDSYVADETPATGHNHVDGVCACGDVVSVIPEVGKGYIFGMLQGNLNKIYYLKGGMDGYYMATTTDPTMAIYVFIEETDGGYYMYCYENGTKTYINMVVSGTHVNGQYAASATTVYTIDEESKTLIAMVNGEPYWFGTRNDKTYTTMGPCKTSYKGFYGEFYFAHNHEFVDGKCACGESEAGEAPHEHNYEYETIVIDPTCTEDGYTVHKCECGDGYIDTEIPATGHNFVEGFCGICGEADPNFETPDEPDEPETPVAGGAADFNTIVTPNANGDSSYKNTYTTENGWVSENSAIQAGGANNSNPQFTVIGPDNTFKAPCLNGKTSAPGKITSPTLSGGISKLVINYTKMFTDTKLGATITITDLATGTVYTNTLTKEAEKNDKYIVWTFEWVLETPITGEFTIEIVNSSPSGLDGNKDRLTILSLTWEGAPAEEPETPDEPAANEIPVTTTDNYTWIDVVEFTATVSGTYTFTLPAGLGAFDVTACDTWPPVPGTAPYVDYYDNAEGATFSIELAAGETTRFYIGALTKADWVITWTVVEGEVGGGDEPTPDEPVVEDVVLTVGDNEINVTEDMKAQGGFNAIITVDVDGDYKFSSNYLLVRVYNEMGMMLGTGSAYLTAGTYNLEIVTAFAPGAGVYGVNVEFLAPVEPEPDEPEQPSGNPVIETLPFTYEVPAEGGLDMNGVYYDFTATEEITLVISHPAGTYVSPTATNDWTSDENDNYILVVNAGETITLNFWAMDTIYEGTFTVTVQTPVHEHSYESVVTAPTCTEGGYTTYSCACGDTYTGDATDALGHDFAQNKCKNCGMAFPKYKDWDADKQIVTHQSFDELYYGAGRTGIFTPGQAAGWNKIVNYTADMATLNYWGWIGAKGDLGQFGYQIDTNAAIFDAGFAVTADAGVVAAAQNTGADNASRMLIPINLGGLSAGAHTVNVLYKNADGEIVALCVFSVLVPDANGNVPSTNPTAIYTADDLAAVPVMNATATKVDNYVRFENTAAQKDKNNPAIELTAAGDGFSDVIVIKYKTNCANYGSNYWGMLNLNGVGDFIGNRANSDNWFVYNMDDEWTILVLDMRKNKATNNAMPNNDITDGANINTITYNFFDYAGNSGKKVASAEHIDIEYIAFFETKADAYAYIS